MIVMRPTDSPANRRAAASHPGRRDAVRRASGQTMTEYALILALLALGLLGALRLLGKTESRMQVTAGTVTVDLSDDTRPGKVLDKR